MNTPNQSKQLEEEMRRLFKDYSVAVSAGMSATRPKTVDDANEALNACIKFATHLFDTYSRDRVVETLEKLKTEMKMHTVPEGHDLITRHYLNNSIDFMVAALRKGQEK